MHKTLILFSLLSIVVLGSCKYYCRTNPYPYAQLVGYDSADLDAVIVKTYAQNGNFQSPENTRIFSSRRNTSYDTVSIYNTYNPSVSGSLDTLVDIGFNADATIEIPALGQKHYIKHVVINSDNWKDKDCTNSMSYVLDDIAYKVPMRLGSNYIGNMPIHK